MTLQIALSEYLCTHPLLPRIKENLGWLLNSQLTNKISSLEPLFGLSFEKHGSTTWFNLNEYI